MRLIAARRSSRALQAGRTSPARRTVAIRPLLGAH